MKTEIRQLRPAAVWSHFYSLTQIPRPSGHMEKVKEFLVCFGESLGLETKIDSTGNVLIVKPASKGYEHAAPVLLQSHLDMVPQANSSFAFDFTIDPIVPVYNEGWVSAMETTLGADNGIGVAAMMAVLEDKTLQHGKLEALFTVDEETGMYGAKDIEPDWIESRVMLNLDSEQEGELVVGCAGGADMNMIFQYREEAEIIEGDIAASVSLTGLKGGHSGVDIHLQRANAIKLMFRFLKEAVSVYGARLASIKGGSARNAIPREAFAVVTIPGEDECEGFWELVSDYQDLFQEEFAGIEENIHFVAEPVDLPYSLIPEEIQDDLINAVEGCQNGVLGYLHNFPGTVESSSNLATIDSQKGKIEVNFLVRSSSESKKEAICSSLESVFALAGAKVEYGNFYPGWSPDIQSSLLQKMKNGYLHLYGKEPEVKVMHAGLECGIILNNIPDMQIVSFGPTIRYPHSPDEKVEVKSVEAFYLYLVKMLYELAL